ncbi:VF530 family DNA-binding protein [Fluviicola taffensis]|uniref:Transporter n=1 Tax=Fluviicola taffensis (strain DSM 16823 / NCIMB 13979 / RW262) TaxID=755732 RepID=F2IBR9_FLUTR|nr:VF530 family protein [Fluviicola taffensis]AEA45395.1 Protein of unknown function DUF2132 [Fluviicola taffensis DSM 16823]
MGDFSAFLIHHSSLNMDPLHGVKLETIVTELVEEFGFERLGKLIPINCFISNPSIKSSLTFLRKTPWARTKVEELYINRIVNIRNSE